jgi:hypothetical protein
MLIFVAIGCTGLIAALWPETYVRYFLAEYQRKALSGNIKVVSLVGWGIFSGCIVVAIALPFHSKWNLLAPVVSPLFFLICAAAYCWWGIWLVRRPESFLKRVTVPWSRLPVWGVRVFGVLLLVGATAFLYGFALRVKGLLR